MSEVGISKSILSVSTPGTHLVPGDSKLAAKTSRHCNIYASALKKRHPDKFGYWASLPLPDVKLAMEEIDHGVSEDADGYCVETNHHGHYLGDKMFDPVFDELNRRKATVFIHPTTPCIACDTGPVKATPFEGRYPNPMLEFFFDTARAFSNLLLSGTFERCPDINWILPHAGGAIPPLLSRVTGFSTLVPGPWKSTSEDDIRAAFVKRIWFDLAGFPFPGQLRGLMASGVTSDRLLYGSDYCFTRANGVKMLAGQMDKGVQEMFSEEEIENIYSGNAVRLLQNRGC